MKYSVSSQRIRNPWTLNRYVAVKRSNGGSTEHYYTEVNAGGTTVHFKATHPWHYAPYFTRFDEYYTTATPPYSSTVEGLTSVTTNVEVVGWEFGGTYSTSSYKTEITTVLATNSYTESSNTHWTTSTTRISVSTTGSNPYLNVNLPWTEITYTVDSTTEATTIRSNGPVTQLQITAVADPTELGVYFDDRLVAFTAGETFITTAFTVNVWQETSFMRDQIYASWEYTFEYNGSIYTENQYDYLHPFRVPCIVTTSLGSHGTAAYVSAGTVTFPAPGTDKVTVTTLWSVKTSINNDYVSNESAGNYVDGGWAVEWTDSNEQLVEVPLQTTIPVWGGGAYLVATTQSGWCVPTSGFHTADASETIDFYKSGATTSLGSTFVTGSAICIGRARRDVSLYVPLGAATPNYQVATVTYVGAGDISRTSTQFTTNTYIKTASTYTGGYNTTPTTITTGDFAPNTYAFTSIDTNDDTYISPGVFIITKTHTENTVPPPETIKLSQTKTASTYYTGGIVSRNQWPVVEYTNFSNGRATKVCGYDNSSLTWTFVALEAGFLIVYHNGTSETSFFSSPTSITFTGSEGSMFSFMGCIPHYSTGNPVSYIPETYDYNYDVYTLGLLGEAQFGRVFALPRYNYEEV